MKLRVKWDLMMQRKFAGYPSGFMLSHHDVVLASIKPTTWIIGGRKLRTTTHIARFCGFDEEEYEDSSDDDSDDEVNNDAAFEEARTFGARYRFRPRTHTSYKDFFSDEHEEEKEEKYDHQRAQYLEVLGFAPGANPTLSQLKAARNKLSLQWHPDKNPNNYNWATVMMAKINHAYDMLAQ